MRRTYDQRRGDYIHWSEMKPGESGDIFLDLATPDAQLIELDQATATPDAAKLLSAKDKRDAESASSQ